MTSLNHIRTLALIGLLSGFSLALPPTQRGDDPRPEVEVGVDLEYVQEVLERAGFDVLATSAQPDVLKVSVADLDSFLSIRQLDSEDFEIYYLYPIPSGVTEEQVIDTANEMDRLSDDLDVAVAEGGDSIIASVHVANADFDSEDEILTQIRRFVASIGSLKSEMEARSAQ